MRQFRVLYTEMCHRVSIIEAESEEAIREAWAAESGNEICDQIFDYSDELSTWIDNDQVIEIEEIEG